MDEFKDFFKDLRDRVSNPYIGSFIISWLITNWPITIAIIFYDQKEIEADGFRTWYQLVKFYGNWGSCLFGPAILAAVYTFGFPIARSYIKLYLAEVKAKNDTKILTATLTESVSLKRYSNMLEDLSNEKKRIQDLYDKEAVILDKNVELQKDLILEKDRVANKTLELSGVIDNEIINKNLTTYTAINGVWKTEHFSSNEFQTWKFDDRNVLINEEYRMTLITYVVNPFERYLAMHLKGSSQEKYNEEHKIFFRINDDFTLLTSTDVPNMTTAFNLHKIT